MEENNYSRSNSSFNRETSSSPQWKYLPPLSLSMDTNSTLDESTESPVYSWKNKPSERKEYGRTSLCRQFDPLHFSSQIYDSNSERDRDTTKKPNLYLEAFNYDSQKDTVISNVPNFPSENALMSFESPKKLPMTKQKYAFSGESVATKKYTEKEVNQILRDHELRLQGEFLRKHHDLDRSFAEKDQALEGKLSQITKVSKWYLNTLSHVINFTENMSSYNMELEAKVISKKNENEELQKDIATSKEDLAVWESSFAEFHKRYEQCKNMLKSYKENEDVLRRSIASVQQALEEKDNMYNLLEVKSQEIMDKAQMEIDRAKKSAGAEIAMLEAQLKKAEAKTYSLENEYKQVKLQNDEIGNICNELMSKIGN